MKHNEPKNEMARCGASLAMRGLAPGTSGNMSVRFEDGFFMTPTGSSMGHLDPGRISVLNGVGDHVDGDAPSKEFIIHHGMYRANSAIRAIIHLHAPQCMALSCLSGLDPADAIEPLTPYFVMRLGTVGVVPYFRPGDAALAEAVEHAAARQHGLILAHHGLIVGGRDLPDAIANAEELEEAARLALLVRGHEYNVLSPEQVAELERVFPNPLKRNAE